MTYRYSLILSIVLHLAAYFSVILHANEVAKVKQALAEKKGPGGGKEAAKYGGVNTPFKIVPKEQPVEVAIIEPKTKEPSLHQRRHKYSKKCPHGHYSGIGITEHTVGDKEIIIAVFRGYPADLADVRVDDEIVSLSDVEISGPKGTLLVMELKRNGVIIIKSIIRDIICY